MKCTNLVRFRIDKKGKKVINKRVPPYSWFAPKLPGVKIPNDLKACGGKISVEIKAVNEPEWGGSYVDLSIEYKCDRCGLPCNPELPQNDQELTVFMNETLTQMSSITLKKIQNKYWKLRMEYEKKIRKLIDVNKKK